MAVTSTATFTTTASGEHFKHRSGERGLSGEQVSRGSLVRVGFGSPEEFQGNEPQKRSPWRIGNRTTPMKERTEVEKAESILRAHGGDIYGVFAIP
jgi:hypothetical protein